MKDDQKTTCPHCNKPVTSIVKHINKHHDAAAKEQETIVCKYYDEGHNVDKILSMPDVLTPNKKSILKTINKFYTKEIIEERRVKSLTATLKEDYAAGKHDDIVIKNIERLKSEEGRTKISKGLKKSYAEGKRLTPHQYIALKIAKMESNQ